MAATGIVVVVVVAALVAVAAILVEAFVVEVEVEIVAERPPDYCDLREFIYPWDLCPSPAGLTLKEEIHFLFT